jgi:hypothetical protein
MSDINFVKRDIVYTGKAMTTDNKVGVSFHVINEDGSLGTHMVVAMKRGRDKTVGGVYTGAEIADNSIRGYDSIRYVRQWSDQADRVTWQANDEQIAARTTAKNLEKNAAMLNDIEKVMAPLRKIYEGHRKRRDFGSMEALEQAALRALRSPPRPKE